MYTCVICLSDRPTAEEAEACANGPHRRCPVCGHGPQRITAIANTMAPRWKKWVGLGTAGPQRVGP